VLGPVFYRFDPRLGSSSARFVRDSDCLRCHGGTFLKDIPALLVRSVFTDGNGEPRLALGSELVDPSTPFEKRWGGWYVTGSHGDSRHRGNLTLNADRDPTATELSRGANLKSLEKLVDTRPYLAASSDLVALLIFEHQATVQNTLTKANQHCLSMLAYQQNIQRDLKETVSEEPVYDSVRHVFSEATQQVVDALLCQNEARLPAGGVVGVGGFASAFERGGKPGAGGQTLRQLDLRSRLLKYRCSYLIQSPCFDGLQPTLRRRVLQRLWHVVADATPDSRYGYLEPGERNAIRAIVAATVPNLPSCWR
jgi:hypothetical protein